MDRRLSLVQLALALFPDHSSVDATAGGVEVKHRFTIGGPELKPAMFVISEEVLNRFKEAFGSDWSFDIVLSTIGLADDCMADQILSLSCLEGSALGWCRTVRDKNVLTCDKRVVAATLDRVGAKAFSVTITPAHQDKTPVEIELTITLNGMTYSKD